MEVLERDEVLGGAVSTVERWPGVRVDRGSSAHVIVRQSGIVEELDLAAHGLRYVDCDPWGFAPAPSPGDPGPDGRPLVFSVDLDATCASIAAACGPEDAVAYDEKFIRNLYEKYGLVISEPVYYGSWCGREKFLSLQDMVLAYKA